MPMVTRLNDQDQIRAACTNPDFACGHALSDFSCLSRFFLWVRVILPAIMFATGMRGVNAQDPSPLLARMRANDAQFVRIQLKYSISGVLYSKAKLQPQRPVPEVNESAAKAMQSTIVKKIDFAEMMKRAEADAETKALAQLVEESYRSKWVANEYSYTERLLVNGKLIAGMRWIARDDVAGAPIGRWLSDNGDIRLLSCIPADENDKKRWILEKDVANRPINSIQEQWMWLQFALGVGYGERIKSVSAVTSEGTSKRLKGQLRVWWADISDFSILVDQDGVVRDAAIHCDVDGNITDIRATSLGHTSAADIDAAAAGTFTCTNSRSRNPSVDFKVSVLELRSESSKEDEAEFRSLVPPTGAEYQEVDYDRIRNRANLKPPIRTPAAIPSRLWLVAMNVVFVLLLLWWIRRNRKAT